MLVAADPYRPAAVDQLKTLGACPGHPGLQRPGRARPCVDIARGGIAEAKRTGRDVVILDTAGRLTVDEALMAEIRGVAQAVQPTETLLVVDAMVGQEAVPVAEAFRDAVAITGLILTKIDGDARGGAALSISAVTGVPVKFMGTGEKTDALEVFHPDRLAGRILGMGDVLTLVERAQETFDQQAGRADGREAQEEQLHARGLPGADAAAQEDGPAGLAAGDDPGPGRLPPSRRSRRSTGASSSAPRPSSGP